MRLDIVEAGTNKFPSDEEALEVDAGEYLGFVRVGARNRELAQ